MLLAVDVGNTQTVYGLYDGERLAEHWRVTTEAERTGDELGVLVGRLLELRDVGFEDIGGVCLSSTVPPLVRAYEEFARDYVEATLLVLGPGTRTGIPISYDDPREVGPDRIANAVAARERYGAPCIVVDFGTSTNFDIVSAEGEYVGGVLAPGIEVSMEALFARAARLVKVDFTPPPSVIGKTTVSGLQSGLVYGFAGQVDGIVKRIRAEIGDAAPVVATGGLRADRPARGNDRQGRPAPDAGGPPARLGPERLSGALSAHGRRKATAPRRAPGADGRYALSVTGRLTRRRARRRCAP